MKKTIFYRICLILIAMAMLLTGCSQKQEAVPEASQEAATQNTTEPTELVMPGVSEIEKPTEEAVVIEEMDGIKLGETFRFADMVGQKNGQNGLTFYYTADGKTLTPFTKASTGDPGWLHENGVLVYPTVIKADNYGVAGSSAKEYVVMGYELPATGTIDLYTWAALQGSAGQHGYRIKVALGDVTNVVCQYSLEGEPQTTAANTYSLQVEKGQTLYMIYEPLLRVDDEWMGYITTVTYTHFGDNSNLVAEVLDTEVYEGDVFSFAALSTNKNGANGLTYYHTVDGETLTPFLTRVEEEDKWYHSGEGVLVYPRMNLADNYGVAGSSANEYVAMSMVMPATGSIQLYSWTGLQGASGSHGYLVQVALDTPTNVVAEYGCVGDTETVVERYYDLEVTEGQTLYMIYEPTVWVNGEWFGYKTTVTYTQVR